MLEDKLLVRNFKQGNNLALQRIYEKYKEKMLVLAVSLVTDRATAEDIIHDVFISFTRHIDKLQLKGNLKSYLLTCVANRARNIHKSKSRQTAQLDEDIDVVESTFRKPDQMVMATEEAVQIDQALDLLPYAQREVLILHLQSQMKFKTIAKSQGVSISTVHSRYRYGLDKLRSLLNGDMEI